MKQVEEVLGGAPDHLSPELKEVWLRATNSAVRDFNARPRRFGSEAPKYLTRDQIGEWVGNA